MTGRGARERRRPRRTGAPTLHSVRAALSGALGTTVLATTLLAAGAGDLAAQERRFRLPGFDRDPGARFEELNPDYDGRFQFVRIRFDVGGGRGFGRGGPPWMHDYPRAERNFMRILEETTFVDPLVDGSQVLEATDPELFRYPVAYIVEVGYWNPSEEDVQALGSYLRKGGFLIVDDFRDQWGEWDNFRRQVERILPGAQLVRLDASHEIFDSFFHIGSLDTLVPATFQRYAPIYYGIYEDNDPERRLLAIVNFNNDIAEYWEFSDRGYYPIDLANEAYKLGVNYIVYALTH